MTGKTHRMGGVLISMLGFMVLKQRGLLVPDVNEGLQWLIMYPFTLWGSTASDLDHHWESCPSRDLPSYMVHKALHITEPLHSKLDKKLTESEKKKNVLYKVSSLFNAKHRSWQTHSELTVFVMLLFLGLAMQGEFRIFNINDLLILRLVITGLCMGVVAHLLLDLLTPEGIWLVSYVFIRRVLFQGKLPYKYEKLHLVPKSKHFKTGSSWERSIYMLLKIAVVISIFYIAIENFIGVSIGDLFSYIPYEITFK